MATKKKNAAVNEELDPTTQKQATSQEDVNGQDSKTRLWQSLNYTYGRQREQSDKQYADAVSQTDRQAQARGMGRSSYNNQTLANLRQKGIEANNDIYAAQIADYQNRLTELESKEAEEAWKQKQFDEQVRQFNENQAFQERQNQLAREFQTSERLGQQAYNTGEREAQQAYQSAENALNRAFQSGEREAQQVYNTSERVATQAYNTSERLGQQAYQSGENALNRAFQTGEREAQQKYNTGEREAQQAFQAGENALNRAQSQSQFETQYNEGVREFDLNLAYQRERNQVADQQWRTQLEEQIRQFNESTAKDKDQFAQQLAEQIREFNILHPNNPVSTGGGGGGRSSGTTNKGNNGGTVEDAVAQLMSGLVSSTGTTGTSVSTVSGNNIIANAINNTKTFGKTDTQLQPVDYAYESPAGRKKSLAGGGKRDER